MKKEQYKEPPIEQQSYLNPQALGELAKGTGLSRGGSKALGGLIFWFLGQIASIDHESNMFYMQREEWAKELNIKLKYWDEVIQYFQDKGFLIHIEGNLYQVSMEYTMTRLYGDRHYIWEYQD